MARCLSIVIGATLIALAASACATRPGVAPPDDATRAAFGVIAAVPVPLPQRADKLPAPVRGAGQGAATGAGGGAATTILAFGYGGGPIGLVVGVILAPVGAVVGGIYGAAAAPDADKVDRAAAAIDAAWRELRPAEAVRDAFVGAAREHAGRAVVPREESGQPTDYRHLAAEGIDTVIELAPTLLAFQSEGRFKPDVSLHLAVRMRAIRTGDGGVVSEANWAAVSRRVPYFTLAEAAPRELPAILDEAADEVAAQAVQFLFLQGNATPGNARQ
jgi:hypothetical protein